MTISKLKTHTQRFNNHWVKGEWWGGGERERERERTKKTQTETSAFFNAEYITVLIFTQEETNHAAAYD